MMSVEEQDALRDRALRAARILGRNRAERGWPSPWAFDYDRIILCGEVLEGRTDHRFGSITIDAIERAYERGWGDRVRQIAGLTDAYGFYRECPKCKAAPYDPCRGVINGRERSVPVHRERA